jgi:hypothetical protein
LPKEELVAPALGFNNQKALRSMLAYSPLEVVVVATGIFDVSLDLLRTRKGEDSLAFPFSPTTLPLPGAKEMLENPDVRVVRWAIEHYDLRRSDVADHSLLLRMALGARSCAHVHDFSGSVLRETVRAERDLLRIVCDKFDISTHNTVGGPKQCIEMAECIVQSMRDEYGEEGAEWAKRRFGKD